MDVGKAITATMRDQRRRDLVAILRGLRITDYHAFQAWLWWGWSLLHRDDPRRKLASAWIMMPGATFPYGFDEPRWLRRRYRN